MELKIQVAILWLLCLGAVFVLGIFFSPLFTKKKVKQITVGKCRACGEEEELVYYNGLPGLCKECFHKTQYYIPVYTHDRKLRRIK